jgi:hypothetical protein
MVVCFYKSMQYKYSFLFKVFFHLGNLTFFSTFYLVIMYVEAVIINSLNDYIAYFRVYVGSLQKRTPSIL